MRDTSGATERSSAKHRSEAEPKAARPENWESCCEGHAQKQKTPNNSVEHSFYIEMLRRAQHDIFSYEFSKIYVNINGAQMVASDSTIYFGVSTSSFPQVIFSFGTAPEYDP